MYITMVRRCNIFFTQNPGGAYVHLPWTCLPALMPVPSLVRNPASNPVIDFMAANVPWCFACCVYIWQQYRLLCSSFVVFHFAKRCECLKMFI